MELKFKNQKPLFVASIICVGLGGFLFINGFLEFVGIAKSAANLSYSAGGIQLSYLIFLAGVLLLASGIFTLITIKTMKHVNLQIFLGIITFSWPTAVTLGMLFIQHVVFIRLLPTILAALFYFISLCVVKIVNSELRTSHKIKINLQGDSDNIKHRKGVNIAGQLRKVSTDKSHSRANISAVGKLANGHKSSGSPLGKMRSMLLGGRRLGSGRSGHALQRIFRPRGGKRKF